MNTALKIVVLFMLAISSRVHAQESMEYVEYRSIPEFRQIQISSGKIIGKKAIQRALQKRYKLEAKNIYLLRPDSMLSVEKVETIAGRAVKVIFAGQWLEVFINGKKKIKLYIGSTKMGYELDRVVLHFDEGVIEFQGHTDADSDYAPLNPRVDSNFMSDPTVITEEELRPYTDK